MSCNSVWNVYATAHLIIYFRKHSQREHTLGIGAARYMQATWGSLSLTRNSNFGMGTRLFQNANSHSVQGRGCCAVSALMASRASCSPAVDVACAVLCRVQPRDQYAAQDYQVCLLESGRLPRKRVDAGVEPERAALCAMSEQTGLQGNAALQQAVFGRPSSSEEHTVTILYAVPVTLSDVSSSTVEFHSLAMAMENPHIDHQDRDMLCTVDQWLRESHAIPFVDPALLFLSGGRGVVKAIIDNPVFSCHVSPPEDQLVISLNNPAFSASHSTLDLHATQA